MCYFPDIDYVNYVPQLNSNSDILPSSPKRMYTLLVNRQIIGNDFLENINNMYELENRIFKLINHFSKKSSLEQIFHLIQIWGGITGRGIYVRQQFDWQVVEPIYSIFVDRIRSLKTLSDETLNKAKTSLDDFYKSLQNVNYKGMGVAFITKHIRFWMYKNLPNSMLPIYDSTFSYNVMLRGRTANVKDLLSFWKVMIVKAKQEQVSLTALERQLFNHFNN